MVSQIIFSLFVIVLMAQRLWELKKSEQNLRRLLEKGGREHSFGHFPFMALLHGAWIVSMMAEVWFCARLVNWLIASIAFAIFAVGQVFRLWAMRDLKERWCARIVTLPNEPPINTGIYAFMRHPNYFGVVLEIAAAPMIHSAYITSLVFSILNGWLLFVRIKAEEKAVYG